METTLRTKAGRKGLAAGLLMSLTLWACHPAHDPPRHGSALPAMLHQPLVLAGPVAAGFNAPEAPTDVLGEELVDFISGAQVSLDASLYKITHDGVVDALLAAQEAGVAVRLVSDTKHQALEGPARAYAALEEAGIRIVFDQKKADMHNKYAVRDQEAVWVGSYNPLAAEHTHADNALSLWDDGIAAAFSLEFEEMFVERRFSRAKSDNTQHEFDMDGTRVEVYFAPTDGVEQRVEEAIRAAQHSVEFLAFSYSADPLAEAMLDQHAAGVEVRGAVDRLQASKRGGDFERLLAAGIDIRRTPFRTMMHHKFILVDAGTPEAFVITGSYNFTNQADERNDESVVIIHSPETVALYQQAFEPVFERCAQLNADGEVSDSLRITEVHANAIDERRGEFVEIVNTSDRATSLRGLYLYDGDAWDRVKPMDDGDFVLQAGQVAVILDPDMGGVHQVGADARLFTVENQTLGDGLTTSDQVAIYGPQRKIPIDVYAQPFNPGNGFSSLRLDLDQSGAPAWGRGLLVGGSPGVFPEPAVETPVLAEAEGAQDELVDINDAEEDELLGLPGVGPVTASRIVSDRLSNGPFCRVDELARVKGIGARTVARLRPFVEAGAAAGCPTVGQEPECSVELNSADAAELMSLPGIGPTTARRILDDRASSGAYQSVNELIRVRGIGPKTLARLLHLVCVE